MNIYLPTAVPVDDDAALSATFRRDFNQHYAHVQRTGLRPELAAQEAHTFALRQEVRRGSGR